MLLYTIKYLLNTPNTVFLLVVFQGIVFTIEVVQGKNNALNHFECKRLPEKIINLIND